MIHDKSHYSVTKSVNWLGLGEENVLKIKTDDTSRIDTVELEAAVVASIAEGSKPLVVSVTAGTTVFGAFDDLNRVADICQQHGIWLHVDVCDSMRRHERTINLVNPYALLLANRHRGVAQQFSPNVINHCSPG